MSNTFTRDNLEYTLTVEDLPGSNYLPTNRGYIINPPYELFVLANWAANRGAGEAFLREFGVTVDDVVRHFIHGRGRCNLPMNALFATPEPITSCLRNTEDIDKDEDPSVRCEMRNPGFPTQEPNHLKKSPIVPILTTSRGGKLEVTDDLFISADLVLLLHNESDFFNLHGVEAREVVNSYRAINGDYHPLVERISRKSKDKVGIDFNDTEYLPSPSTLENTLGKEKSKLWCADEECLHPFFPLIP